MRYSKVGFLFFPNFLDHIESQESEIEANRLLMAVARYGVDGVEPLNLTEQQEAAFRLIRKQIDAQKKRYKERAWKKSISRDDDEQYSPELTPM